MSEKNKVLMTLKIKEVKPYKQNARAHDTKHINEIARSIKQLGYIGPIIVDENYEILAGHGRFHAITKLKYSEIECLVVSNLTEEQKRLFRLADNKLSQKCAWNEDLLKIELSELQEISLDSDLDISLSGFDTPELDLILYTDEKGQEKEKKEDSIPFIPENEIVSKLGDLWFLGKHKIYCGNSLEKESYEILLKDERASMILTDAPYNVKIQGHVCGAGKIKHKEFAMASGEMSQSEFTNFLKTFMKHCKDFSKKASLHYLFMDWRHSSEILEAGNSVFDDLKNICVWNKQSGGMGSLYRSQHEFIFIFKNGKGSHTNNVELGKHGRYRTNVWSYPGISSFAGEKNNLKLHPTCKAIKLLKDAILDVTHRNEIVLDVFLGSGSTLLASEQCRRICYAIELEPLYVDTAIRRYQELSGSNAIHEKTGKTYNQLLEEKIKKGTSNE